MSDARIAPPSFGARALGSAPLILFAAMLVYIGLNAPNFLSLFTLELILVQSLPVVIVCSGLSLVVMTGGDDVVSGGIDLSIPATAVLCAGIVAQWLSGDGGLGLATVMALLAALAVGLVNAALVTRIGVTPLLTTLSMFVAVVGINNVVTQSRRIGVDHPAILWLRDADVLGWPVSIPIALLVALALYHLAHRTRLGLHMQATGGSRDAAEISGLDTRKLQALSFVLAALAGFAASFFLLARGSGSSPGTEDNLLLEMVLATFLGAAFSPRRVVTLWGAVLGAILVAAISIGFKSMGVDVFWTGLIKGSLILIVVAFGSVAQRGR
ncbi:ABC transporter permease [Palleronia sp. LCG004]|uniref:ABC transporter permease n=1 Tax=Palleronia sp. LCG004 TaxID=3079304 RepID=UPI002943DD64|nr:ABC transporter permease [Palleronia sp. LCG004]WOI56286.1 ABC transporter permease [Palleronia sp. LCG004]